MREQRITLSFGTLAGVLAALAGVAVFWQLRGLLVTLMIAVVLAASIVPVVDRAERLRLPRWLTVLVVYLGLILGLTGVGVLIGPTVIDQVQRLIRQSPIYVSTLRDLVEAAISRISSTRPELVRQFFNPQDIAGWSIRSADQLLRQSLGVTTNIVGGFFSLVLSLFISGYMAADSKTLINGITQLFPEPWDQRLQDQAGPIGERMGSYIRGRILVSAVLAVGVTLGLSVLGMSDFAIGLGAIAGVTNLIPFLGPVLGAVPALIVALPQGGWLVLWVLVLFVLIQNLETYVLDPLLVGSSVGLHPLYQLLAVLGGTQVLGIIGALIVPPWVAGAAVLLENLYLKPKLQAEAAEAGRAAEPDLSSPRLPIAPPATKFPGPL
ncbi:AI-2E family transporter [Leptolyngbya sp. FACHB-261]|nr:AI-2E family transporter [Leptolyngbya sp. FACHB-261]